MILWEINASQTRSWAFRECLKIDGRRMKMKIVGKTSIELGNDQRPSLDWLSKEGSLESTLQGRD